MKKFVTLFLLFASLSICSEGAVKCRYLRVVLPHKRATLSLAEVQIYSGKKNVALQGHATQSETAYGAGPELAIDGNTDTRWEGKSITHTPENNPYPWWEVDLNQEVDIDKIVLWNRSGYGDRLNGCRVLVLDARRRLTWGKDIPRPSDRDTVLTPDSRDKYPTLGRVYKKIEPPVSDREIIAAYVKGKTWIDSLLALHKQLSNFRSLSVVIPLLLKDFPDDAEDIRSEFIGSAIYHDKMSGSYAELALRYIEALPAPLHARYGKGIDQIKSVEDLKPIRSAFRNSLADRRLQLLLDLFNPVALERAINSFSAHYPELYRDRERLLKRVEELKDLCSAAGSPEKRLALAREIDALYDSIYLRHPALDFKDILLVRRSIAGQRGLPANWQGNSSTALHGYINDVVRVPLKQGKAAPVSIYASSCFVGDVDLDYDADRIMFSTGKPNQKGWRVFESKINGEGVHEITPPTMNDIDFYDPCYLPDGRRLFVATSGFHGVPCVTGRDYVGNIHLMERDGSIRRLVFDQDNSWYPMVMDNGRILFLRWEYTDSAHYFSRVLMTMNPDGSDQQEFFGSGSYWPNSCFYARTLPGSTTRFVGIVSGHHGVQRMGMLTLFDISKGRIEVNGAVQSIPGYGKPVQNRTLDQLVRGLDKYFLHPYPLSEDLFLTSLSLDARGPFFVALVDRYDNLIPLWQSASDHLFEPIPLKPRSRPVLPVDRVVKGEKECTVYMVSAEEGPGLFGLPKGVVKSLRLFQYEYAPRNTGGHYHIGFEGPWDPRTILGTVKVEEDGSCMFKAPANTPISVQPLDKDGKALQLMRSWLVGMPGETIACMGCHEKQNASAPARHSIAGRKPPQQIRPWYGPRRNYAFVREVQSVLDRSCVGCHNSKSSGKNALGQRMPNFENTRSYDGFSTSYVNLMPYVRRNGPEGDYHILTPLEFHADTSELIQMLEKGHHGVKLSAEEMDRLITWIDLNLPYWGTWTERNGKGVQHNLERRREMAKLWANIDYNHEVIVNPYRPVSFVPPVPPPAPTPAPKVEGWPIRDPRAAQGVSRPLSYRIGDFTLDFVKIPSGTFVMGSNSETPMERPMGVVTIGKPFLMATKEITQGLFREFDPEFENGVYDMHYKDQVKRGYYMGPDPEFAMKGCLNFPAIRVSWKRANEFCEWLGKRINRRVMLPTEAQWEWACRAGTDTPMNYGNFDVDFGHHENLADATLVRLAVWGVNPRPRPNPPPLWDYELRDRRFNDGILHLAEVGRYAPNAWGLYDMHGNVAEWTRSAYRPYPYREGDGRNNGVVEERKVVRGGSWSRRSIRSTSSWRWGYPGWQRPFDVGFRVIIEE